MDRLGQAKSSSILSHNYRSVLGNTSSGNSLSKEHMNEVKSQLDFLKKKGDGKGQMRLIS